MEAICGGNQQVGREDRNGTLTGSGNTLRNKGAVWTNKSFMKRKTQVKHGRRSVVDVDNAEGARNNHSEAHSDRPKLGPYTP